MVSWTKTRKTLNGLTDSVPGNRRSRGAMEHSKLVTPALHRGAGVGGEGPGARPGETNQILEQRESGKQNR